MHIAESASQASRFEAANHCIALVRTHPRCRGNRKWLAFLQALIGLMMATFVLSGRQLIAPRGLKERETLGFRTPAEMFSASSR